MARPYSPSFLIPHSFHIHNMRLPILYLALSLSLAALADGRLTWLETEHDFGTFAEELKDVSCVMRAVNTGDTAVVISDVVTTCGCTSRTYTRGRILPGDTATVTLTYHASGRAGAFSKTAFVYTNTPQHRTHLTITGNVIATPATINDQYPVAAGALRLDTRTIPFGPMRKGTSRIAYLRAYNSADDTVQIAFTNVPKHIQIDAYPTLVPPHGKSTITAFFNTFDTDCWELCADSLTLLASPTDTTSATPSGMARIDVMGVVDEDFSNLSAKQLEEAPVAVISSRLVDLGTLSQLPQANIQATVTVSNAGKKSPLLLRRAFTTHPAISFAHTDKPVKAGHNTDINININTALLPAGQPLNAVATIVTSDPMHPKQYIRIVALP